ncbi:MAG TPA: hypothetical protein VGH49_01830 [Xanthobacteraceae bacterium]
MSRTSLRAGAKGRVGARLARAAATARPPTKRLRFERPDADERVRE